ncbi:NADH-dependent phenylglyoxylate dehydrogenase subunit epsilon [Motiliproteus sp. SC1-56]|uniref:NADH-dependent phenylglyoxylate dehydrogenase subunit epsilon n=1 Tax=Motiliproteus sp. SC1-56 TaxID=2799565 RepID=UPI001A8CB478|nr:FAD-dependent oxidoreductase [Motiliproteus sp. SC1-56]
MNASKYLIVGSSHAALEAARAIRMQDDAGSITLISRDTHAPYSPTVLPYVVSGRSSADRVSLRTPDYFQAEAINRVTGQALTRLLPAEQAVELEDGQRWHYEKLLLATGATPVIPPVPGLDRIDYRVLRTLDDAIALRDAAGKAANAVVLGAGLVGMHGAENLAEAGIAVSVVEMQSQVLPGYFDAQAAELIRAAFDRQGVTMKMGRRAQRVEPQADGCRVHLDNGEVLNADLLLVGTGVRPVTDYCQGSGLDLDQGILVDDHMATNLPNIWAAGDVAQARDFYSDAKVVTGILPDAVEQGRIAGMAMVEDPALQPYRGGVPINTYTFYGQQAISVGISDTADTAAQVAVDFDAERGYFQKIILKDGRLQGISAINAALDPGILWQLILRRTDLSEVKAEFLAQPLETGRRLMSDTWR